MPRIEWEGSFSVNNREIDDQHKKWIAIINELHDSMMKGDISLGMTLNTMKSMKEYVKYHFEYEEEYMRKINYPGMTEHIKIHARFYVLISQYYNDLQSGKMVLNSEIMSILMNWLKDHILNTDKKYISSIEQ